MDVPESAIALDDLVELKMLPAWANEPVPADRYAHIDGGERGERKHERPGRERPPRKGPTFKKRLPGREPRPGEKANERFGQPKRNQDQPGAKNRTDFAGNRENRPSPVEQVLPKIEVRFLPRAPVIENIVAQIKEDNFAYSLFALARLFLAKPERYEVRLTATEQSPLFRLGENGETSADREFLERSAFRLAQTDFYKIEVTQSDPIKGNFTSIAR